MTDRVVSRSEAPFHEQENGINLGQMESEVVAATGMAATSISSDGADITFTFVQQDPPTVAQLLAVVQVHDGRPQAVLKRVEPDGKQVVALGLPVYDAPPTHQSIRLTAALGTTTVVTHKFAADARLMGGRFWIDSTAVLGDTVKVELVDVDGVLPGNTGGEVLGTPVPGLHIPPDGTGQGFVELNSGQAIPVYQDTYIRYSYVSIGGSDVEAISYWLEIEGHGT